MSKYSDEASYTLPWDLFTRQTAEDALQSARRLVGIVKTLPDMIKNWREEGKD